MHISLTQARFIRRQYESGFSTYQLAEKLGCSRVTISRAVKLAKGKIRRYGRECHVRIQARDAILRSKYESGLSVVELGKMFKLHPTSVQDAIFKAGGKIRPRGWKALKYYELPYREKTLYTKFRLTLFLMKWLRKRQQGKCLWCKTPLPLEGAALLKCIPDHIGGEGGLRDRSKIRGLVCSRTCNCLAGFVEANHDAAFLNSIGLLKSFIRHVQHILKTNAGRLPFPEFDA